MACRGRYRKVEGGTLPAVTNYDYEDNISIRGTNDRSFRFEETCSESSYLFQEKTSNGTLDEFTGEFTGRFQTRAASDGGPESTGVFSGWTAYGETTTHIPNTGIYLVTGEHLLATYDTFFTRSIFGDTSIGMFGGTSATIADHVGIYQSGISLTANQKHQLYAQLKLANGTEDTLNSRIWVEGYTGTYTQAQALAGTNTVAVYNTGSRTWVSDRPTNNVVAKKATTEVVFDFTTSNFPADTPTNYALFAGISGLDGNKVVIFDDLHIDQYMQKNAFTDVIVPSGYLIQITPDLGWHDTMSMFSQRESTPNPHLVTLGPYVFQSGLSSNQDGSVTASLSEDEFDSATSDNYRKYLWRAVAVSTNGTIGDEGFPRRFAYMGRIFEEEFEVTGVWDDPMSITKVITGKKSPRMTILVDGTANPSYLEYPNDTSWKITIVMDSSERQIAVQGRDKGGAITATQYINLKSDAIALTEKKLWNLFDEHGLLLGLDRLPGETNEEFSERIKDAFVNPGTHFFEGAVDGGTREVGLDRYNDAINLKFTSRETPTPLLLTVQVTSSSLLLRTSDLEITEVVLVDPVDLTCTLANRLSDDPLLAELVDGSRINIDQVRVYDDKSEQPNLKKIQFEDESLGGKLVSVTYPFYREYTYTQYPTLGQLVAAIRNFTDLPGNKVLTVGLHKNLSGGESSNGLYVLRDVILEGADIDISWSPMFLKKVGDRLYRESFRNSDGTLWNTKFYKWVSELKSNTNTEWGHVQADKAFWDAADNRLDGFDHLPTLMDPTIVDYLTTGGRNIDAEEATLREFTDEYGNEIKSRVLQYTDFTAGVAYKPDLIPDLLVTTSNAPGLSDVPDTVVGTTGNTRITFFSGTIN
ncbi:MAG: hypothetical protein ACXABY_00185 [Candidatus Thorarchaeota archaeon]